MPSVQILNSGVISGPEMLVLQSASRFSPPHTIIFLEELRLGEKGREPAEFAKKLGLTVETIPISSRFDLKAVRRLRLLLETLSPQIVHAHDVKATFYTWLATRGRNWKVVSTHHGVEGRPNWKTKLYELFYSVIVLPRMTAVVAVSPGDKDILEGRGIAPKKIHFVANGISKKLWKEMDRHDECLRLRQKWAEKIGGFSDSTLFIGMVARLSEEKRHEYFLRVLYELKKIRPELRWKFLAFGSGSLAEYLKDLTKNLGLATNCHWMGYQEEASSVLPGFDVVALTSSAEGLPIISLEAGWAGVPLFTSDVGMLPEIIGVGSDAGGITFPRNQEFNTTAEKLCWLLEHKEERERFGLNLQNRVEKNFSSEAYVHRLEAVYRSI